MVDQTDAAYRFVQTANAKEAGKASKQTGGRTPSVVWNLVAGGALVVVGALNLRDGQTGWGCLFLVLSLNNFWVAHRSWKRKAI